MSKTSTLITKLFQEYHIFAIGGHLREFKTYQHIAKDWYWEGMRKQITQFVRECLGCQPQKGSNLQPAGLLQPLPILSQVWEDVTVISGGFETISC